MRENPHCNFSTCSLVSTCPTAEVKKQQQQGNSTLKEFTLDKKIMVLFTLHLSYFKLFFI
jgi:hypothetical protein